MSRPLRHQTDENSLIGTQQGQSNGPYRPSKNLKIPRFSVFLIELKFVYIAALLPTLFPNIKILSTFSQQQILLIRSTSIPSGFDSFHFCILRFSKTP